jgi:peroxiredoxin
MDSANITVLGISFDQVDDQKAFADEQEFGYRLLSDPDRTAGAAYDAIRPPDAKFPDFPRRITYLIDPEGIIRRTWDLDADRPDDLTTHSQDVLDAVAELA